jgi:glycosyltransferase involved in cell wall biosynthesis
MDALFRLISIINSWSIKGLEIIVIDDRIDSKCYSQIGSILTARYIWAPGIKGPAESRNIGILLARGRRIIFLDDDDFISREWLEFNLKELPEGLIFSDYIRVQDGKKYKVDLSGVNKKSQMVTNRIPVGAFSLSLSFARNIKFDVDLKSHEDWDFLLSVQQSARLIYVKGMLSTLINISNNGRNINSSINHFEDFKLIYTKYKSTALDVSAARRNLMFRLFSKRNYQN